jgi:type VI secretion system protein ImpM
MPALTTLEATPAEPDRVGVFGKVPTRGDFVSLGIAPVMRKALDQWLQNGLAVLSHSTGANWEKRFHSMPAWRFIITTGVWGKQTLAGILIPSQDRVGRSFPLVLAAQLGDFESWPKSLYEDAAWFDEAEDIAEAFVSTNVDAVQLSDRLRELRLPYPRDGGGKRQGAGKPIPASLWWRVDKPSGMAAGFTTDERPRPADFLRLVSDAAAPSPRNRSEASVLEKAQTDPVSMPLVWSCVKETHPGTRLSLNADSLLASAVPAIAAVADGIGDHSRSIEAGRAVIEAISSIPPTSTIQELIQEIKGKLGRANGLLQATAGRSTAERGSASTVVAAIFEGSLVVVWAGDARCYLVREGLMRCLTQDHIDVGIRRTLYNAVGMHQQFVPDVLVEGARNGDVLMLCSAPLVRSVPERAIAEILSNAPFERTAEVLVQEALIGNCKDNLSAIVIALSRS